MENNKFLDNLKTQAEENPILAIAAAAALLQAGTKFVNAIAWKQEVARRVAQQALKTK